MCRCHSRRSCHGCCHSVDRRGFLRAAGAVAASAAGPAVTASAAQADAPRPKVAAVFLANINIREIWPYPDFDTHARQREVMAALAAGCPDVEFLPVTVESRADVPKALAMKDRVDGYLVYVMTLDWSQRRAMVQLAELGKPTLMADEFLGGSGVFLTGYGELCSRKIPAAAVATTRMDDLVAVARQFATVRRPGTTPESFAKRCEAAYRPTFGARGDMQCVDDPLELADVGRCVERLRESRFLIVTGNASGAERDFLGATGRHVGFDELAAEYAAVDRDEAAEWAKRWRGDAGSVMEPLPEAIDNAGAVYLAIRKLLAKYDTDNITMNCLGGFAAGKLAAYPCLGFMQLLNDGAQGVCEAMPDDTLSMMMARLLTGRPGFVSDPALDTSKNQIVYAHCVATTKPLGTDSEANDFRIRTLHNRDRRGACAESMLPAGYMTTTFRTNVQRKQLILHRAKSVGTLDSERGCRTKLIGEVAGDVGRLFDQWDQFGWHRVTVYGDVAEPMAEFAKALGLEVIREA